jgi:hemerythrin superfamily protein
MPRRSTKTSSARSKAKDAIALLKADHKQVKQWFAEFEKARSVTRQAELAERICAALKAHTQIEEEIFYPAFYEATDEKDIHHEAIVEHAGAKKLIAEIEAATPNDELYEAKVTVLSEMIKHHVKEEEQPGGMFAKARQSDMDLRSLGEQLLARKTEILRSGAGGGRKAKRAGASEQSSAR